MKTENEIERERRKRSRRNKRRSWKIKEGKHRKEELRGRRDIRRRE